MTWCPNIKLVTDFRFSTDTEHNRSNKVIYVFAVIKLFTSSLLKHSQALIRMAR